MSQSINIDVSPAERRRRKVRVAILEAAERVFAVEGESGLSIRRLAEEIDYSPSAIYKYFGSKDELVDQLKEQFFERLMSRVDHSSPAASTFEDRVRRCIGTYIEVAIERPHHYLAAFASLGDGASRDPRLSDWNVFQTTKKGQAFGIVVALVQEGQCSGRFDPGLDPYLAAKSLWASMHGLAVLLIHLPDFPEMRPDPKMPLSPQEFIAFHSELMLRSLQPPNFQTDP